MNETLWEILLACVVFTGGHMAVSSTPLRPLLVARLGEKRYSGLYALAALAAMVWMIFAYMDAPYVELWEFAEWMRWVPILVMPLACVLVVAGVSTPNPTIAGAGEEVLAAGPRGIVKVTRHPMMWGMALWGFSHLPSGGDGASLILFGSMIVLALAGTLLIDARKKAAFGAAWEPILAGTSNLPLAAIMEGRAKVGLAEIGWGRMAGGLVLYALLFSPLHRWLFGSAPLVF